MNIKMTILNFFYIVIGAFCSLYCFITAFEIPVSPLPLALFCIIPALFLCASYYYFGHSKGDIILLFSLLLIGIVALIFRSILPDAIDCTTSYFLNKLAKLNVMTSTVSLPLESKLYSIVPFFCAIMALLALLLVILIHRFRLSFFSLLITFPLVEVGLFFGAVPNKICFFLYIIFLLLQIERFRFKKREIPKGFTATLAICIGICILFSNTLLIKMDYQRPFKWNSMRNAIILRDYETLGNLIGIDLESLFSAFSNHGNGINAGNLSNLGNKSKSTRTALKVTLPHSYTTVYLRGYASSYYTKNHWSIRENKEYDSLLSSYEKETSFPLTPLELFSYSQTLPYLYQTNITIEPKRADKSYAYVPYSMLPNDSVTEVQDLYYKPKSNTNQSYTIPVGTYLTGTEIKNSTFDALSESSSTSASFFNSTTKYDAVLDAYSAHFSEDYLTISKSLASALSAIAEALESKANYILADYPETVQSYLEQIYTYTLTPKKAPKNEDATLYFLQESREGYCVHFASSATLLLRAMGIPARYVEGYVISPNDFSKGSFDAKTGQYTVNVPESNAHAWTEYYTDDNGWQILDATPGYTESSIASDPASASQSTTASTQEAQTQQEATSETASTATTADNNSPQKSKGNKADNNGFSFQQWLKQQSLITKLMLSILGLFLLFILLCLIRRGILVQIRHYHWHGEDANKNAIAMLSLLTYLFTISSPSKAEQKIWEERMKPLFDLARYSQHTITKEQLEEIERMVIATEKKLKKQLPFLKRLYYEYLAKRIL